MFRIDTREQTREFVETSAIEEVGGPRIARYASAHGDAQGLEYFL